MKRRLYLGAVSLILILAASVSIHALQSSSSANDPGTDPVSSSLVLGQSKTESKNQNQTAGQPIDLTGTIECLTPKNTSGPQVTSCAIGLKQDDGDSYAISSQDPMITGSLPTRQRVRVNGVLSQQPSKYDIKGIVNVASVQRL